MLKRFEGYFPAGAPEWEILRQIDPGRLPRHIAVTMDGNGRWAQARNLPRNEGHKAGTESAREACECAARLGIEHLTLFTFSSENWKRPIGEVRFLMEMLHNSLIERLEILQKNDIRLHILGDTQRLPAKLRRKLLEVMENSRSNRGLQVNLALNYGSRQELVHAVRQIAAAGIAPARISEKTLAAHLYTAGMPDPDLLIRTSGEMRISNFLLYQIAYAELYFTPVFWPDFRARHLLEAVSAFQQRNRRFGTI